VTKTYRLINVKSTTPEELYAHKVCMCFFQLWYVVGNHTGLVGGFAMTDACGNSSSSLYVSVCRTTCTRDLHNFL